MPTARSTFHPRAGYLKGAAHLGRWKGVVVATTARCCGSNERDYTADVFLLAQRVYLM